MRSIHTRERGGHLEPGEVRPGAAMDARAEGDVAVLRPVDDELVGVLELLGVVAGRREVHQDLVAAA